MELVILTEEVGQQSDALRREELVMQFIRVEEHGHQGYEDLFLDLLVCLVDDSDQFRDDFVLYHLLATLLGYA